MNYVVKVEKRIGAVPNVEWRCIFEQDVEVPASCSLHDVISILHVLYGKFTHRVIVLSCA